MNLYYFFLIKKKAKINPFLLLVGFSKTCVCVWTHQRAGALKGFTINLCLSREKGIVKSVRTVAVFLKGEGN